MFLPTTREEMDILGWDRLDVILITGDSYIDSPFIGTAVIGKVLQRAGYRVGVIAQPDIHSDEDITRLGEPRLFWGVTGGSIDSMVANYTSLKKKRRNDDYTPGGSNNRRPDRAVIIYANLLRRYFKKTKPIVLGGIEASLRRVPHYDFWSDSIRSSILFDAKADYLLYGMAEKAVIQLAEALKDGTDPQDIRGLCYIAGEQECEKKRLDYLELPPYETVREDKKVFGDMFNTFYQNNDALTAKGLYQKHGSRYLIHNPPPLPLTQTELDAVYALDYDHAQHPFYEQQGKVRALETIKFAIPTHRGCYGECYKAGQNDYTTVITAQQNLLNIQNSLVQTSSNELIGYVGAFKALGGGWTADMSPPKLPDQMVADMTDRTDWGSVLTRTGDPLTVKAGKFLVDAPDPSKPAQTTVPATLNTPSNTTTPPTQGSAAP